MHVCHKVAASYVFLTNVRCQIPPAFLQIIHYQVQDAGNASKEGPIVTDIASSLRIKINSLLQEEDPTVMVHQEFSSEELDHPEEGVLCQGITLRPERHMKNSQMNRKNLEKTFFFKNQDRLGQKKENCFMTKDDYETFHPVPIKQHNPSFTAHFR